jgi:hypothetical protein
MHICGRKKQPFSPMNAAETQYAKNGQGQELLLFRSYQFYDGKTTGLLGCVKAPFH